MVSELRENNKDIAAFLKNNGEQVCYPAVRQDVCSDSGGKHKERYSEVTWYRVLTLRPKMSCLKQRDDGVCGMRPVPVQSMGMGVLNPGECEILVQDVVVSDRSTARYSASIGEVWEHRTRGVSYSAAVRNFLAPRQAPTRPDLVLPKI